MTANTSFTPVTLVNACIVAAAARIEAEGRKGVALYQAHAVLDVVNSYEAVDKAAAAAREAAGGKGAPKHVQAGYKLAKRFAACAKFLESHGLTFAAIGEVIGEKKTFSVNLCEYAAYTGDDVARKAYATAWQATKGAGIVARCAAGEAAEEAAITEINAANALAARDALRAEIMAELKAAESTTKNTTKKTTTKKTANRTATA